MNVNRIACMVMLAGAILGCATFPSPAHGQMTKARESETAGSVSLVVTAEGKGSRPVPRVERKDVAVRLKNQPVEISAWQPYQGDHAGLQLVFLIDESVRSYFSLQIPSLKKFVLALPPSAEVGVAYMNNGRPVWTQKLTSDHALAAKSFRLPNGIPGISGSPYFCLSDLAKHWISQAQSQVETRRVVFMVTNGQDPYYRSFDMQDPYVAAAIADSQRAGLLVYSIYFRNVGAGGSGSFSTTIGQSYLLRVANETGGQAYSEALSSPVSFDPFLKRFKTSLENQYKLTIPASGSGLQSVSVKSTVRDVKLYAAKRVDVNLQR